MVFRKLCLALALMSTPAWADHLISIAGGTHADLGGFTSSNTAGASASWAFVSNHFGFGAGARVDFALNASSESLIEGFARGLLTTRIKAWAPLLAIEVGMSGTTRAAQYTSDAGTLFRAEKSIRGPMYVAMHTELLRFFVDRITISALAFDVGTYLPQPGAFLRVRLDYLTVGVRL